MAHDTYKFVTDAIDAQKRGKTILCKTEFGTCGFARSITRQRVTMAEGDVTLKNVIEFYSFDTPRDAFAFMNSQKVT
jgi:hypothetical protein